MDFLDFFNSGNYSSVTDKGTTHDYIRSFYNEEFTPIRNSPVKILEIGVDSGGSLKLFKDWFVNGTIKGIDIKPDDRRKMLPSDVEVIIADAYSQRIADMFQSNYFDYIIDDGPHTIESQIEFIRHWMPVLKPGGKLIIEDIQNPEQDIEKIKSIGIPFKVIDSRKQKGRYDDVIIVIARRVD